MLHDYRYQGRGRRQGGAAFSPGASWGVLRILLVDNAVDPDDKAMWDLISARDDNVQVLTPCQSDEATRPGDISLLYTSEGCLRGAREIKERGFSDHAIFWALENSQNAGRLAEQLHFDGTRAARTHDLVQAAEAMGAELLVTNEPFALTNRGTRETHATNPVDALAVVGLRQRLSGSGQLWSSEICMPLGLHSLEIMESWRLLPRTHDLFGVDRSNYSERWLSRLRVGFTRVQRCLRIRDRILVHAINPEDALPFDSPDALVEGLALQISGMFDSLAVAVGEALALEVRDQSARFSNRAYRRMLPPEFEPIIDQRALTFLTAISLLRNTIHGEPLGAAARGDDRGSVERLLVLVSAEADQLRGILPILRPDIDLGVTDLGDLGVALDPVQVVETIVPFAVGLFEAIVGATPWPVSSDRPDGPRLDDPIEDPYHFPLFQEQNRRYYGLGRFVRNPGQGTTDS